MFLFCFCADVIQDVNCCFVKFIRLDEGVYCNRLMVDSHEATCVAYSRHLGHVRGQGTRDSGDLDIKR